MKFAELFPLQIVINLDKRPDRLKICIEKEFPKIEAHPIRKPGFLFNETNNKWWNGAIGCMINHYHILQAAHLIDTNVFIFEDDVSFISGYLPPILETICEQLNNMDWDMFYLGGNLLKPCYKVTSHLAKLTHCQSTVAYGINKNFLEKLLGYFDFSHIDRPIDMIYADTIIPNHNCFITIPMICIQRNSYSDIENKEVNYSDYLENRYWENLVLDKREKV